MRNLTKMRTLVRAVRQFRPALRSRGNFVLEGSSDSRDFWFNMDHRSLYSLSCCIDRISQSRYSHMNNRAISTDVATFTNGGWLCIVSESIFLLEVGMCLSKQIIYILIYLTDLMTEVNGGGPLLEYERRIAAGELLDGDECQVCLLFLVINSLCCVSLFGFTWSIGLTI